MGHEIAKKLPLSTGTRQALAKRLKKLICQYCGTRNPPRTRKCRKCGRTKFRWKNPLSKYEQQPRN